MQKVEAAIKEKESDLSNHPKIQLLDDPESCQLIADCHALLVEIEGEIGLIHTFIQDKDRLKFPELESLVSHPSDYARVVKEIGNETDLAFGDLQGVLPSEIIVLVSAASSTTIGKPLQYKVLRKTMDACDRALALGLAKKTIIEFLASRMGLIAPNLSAVVGSYVAAQLVGAAGGVSALEKMNPCSVQRVGATRENLAGLRVGFLSQAEMSPGFRVGFLWQTEMIQSAPPSLKMRAVRLVAAKSTLAALVDSAREDLSGNSGRLFSEEIRKKIEKW